MSKVVAIARDHVALQLALAGVTVDRVKDAEEADELLRNYLESEEVEMLLFQEELRDGLTEVTANTLKRHKGRPLVVFCPSFEQEDSDVDAYLSAIIKPAVGYEIRLE
jgi:vacuolar-type H+-ATPase subunit F/Vma7